MDGQGYVLRGHTGWGSSVLLANSDGAVLDRSKVIDAIVSFMIEIASDDCI